MGSFYICPDFYVLGLGLCCLVVHDDLHVVQGCWGELKCRGRAWILDEDLEIGLNRKLVNNTDQRVRVHAMMRYSRIVHDNITILDPERIQGHEGIGVCHSKHDLIAAVRQLPRRKGRRPR